MGTLLVMLACSALLAINLNIKSENQLKIGGNFSTFRDVKSNPRVGFTLGIGRELIRYKNFSVSEDILLTNKRVGINNTTVHTIGMYCPYIHFYNIKYSAFFAEVPILFKYDIPTYRKFIIQLIAGTNLSIYLTDISDIRPIYKEYIGEEKCKDFKYYFFISEGHQEPLVIKNSGFGFNFGIAIKRSNLIFELHYTKDFHKIKWINHSVYSQKSLQAFYFLLGVDI